MMILGRDAILKAPDRKEIIVDVAEWGGAVRLYELTGRERSDMYRALVKPDGTFDSARYAVLVTAMSIAGEDGSRLFTIEDADLLMEKANGPLEKLFEHAQKLNGLGNKAAEDSEKNSGTAPSGDGS